MFSCQVKYSQKLLHFESPEDMYERFLHLKWRQAKKF